MWKRKWFKFLVVIIFILGVTYVAGPSPDAPEYNYDMPVVPSNSGSLEKYIAEQEAQHRIKPNNQARIVWLNDSLKNKTPYSIVYLHGFSASQEEGRPIHTNIAEKFGCNLYLSRLAEHGIDTIDPLKNLTPEKYWESAKQALAIGRKIGQKVIVMGTSTGGTLALKLAAEYPEEVYALVLLSPNVAINNNKAFLLNNPWGLQIARFVTHDDYITASDNRDIYKQYWNWHYPLEATVQLQELIETTMVPEVFAKVKQPVLMLYYYRDDIHQDSVVSVPAMLDMFNALGTPRQQKVKQPITGAGDHVIGSYIKSQDLLSVQNAVEAFMINVLKITPSYEQTIKKQDIIIQ